jgi:hypothetical protein
MSKSFGRFAVVAALSVLVTLPLGGVAAAKSPSGKAAGTSVGVYPSSVVFSQTMRGGQYVETIGVINGTGVPRWFHFALTGAVAPWLQILPSVPAPSGKQPSLSRFLVQANGAPGRAVLRLQVPKTAANGTYKGKVTVSILPPKIKGKTTVGVGEVIQVIVRVTGTEIISGKLVNAYTYPKIEVGAPLRVFAVVKNSSNVAVQPSFHFQILKAGARKPVYNWIGTTGEAVLPGLTSTYELDWPAGATQSAVLGEYTARIASVTFPRRKDVGSWSLPFRLYPYGALHRGGQLLSLKLANRPKAGGQALVNGSVVSAGEVQQETNFVGQIYRNGSFVQAVKSPVPLLLAPKGQPGDTGTLVVPVPVPKNGLYHLTGVANFAGAQSQPMTLTFRVGPAPLSLVYEIAIGAGAVVLAALIVGLVFFFRRRRRPPALPSGGHVPPRYTASHPLTLHVPPRTPVGSAAGRPHSRVRRG